MEIITSKFKIDYRRIIESGEIDLMFRYAIDELCNQIPEGVFTKCQQLKKYDFTNTIISRGIPIFVGWLFIDYSTVEVELFISY